MTSPAASALALSVGQIAAGDLAHVEEVRRRTLAFCAEHPDALHRTNPVGHLTGSALVVDPADGRFVVLHHRKLDRWLQPGGHADGEADLAAVALREATEETGLAGLQLRPGAVDLDIHEVRPPGEPAHLHLDLRFLVLAPAGTAAGGPPPGNHESHEVRWVSATDLGELHADESLRRLVERGLRAASTATRPRG